jgi:transaldolase
MTTQQNKQDVLGQLTAEDVSIWLDDISRERLTTGNLAMLVKDFHVRGVTSNPTIFAHAMEKGTAYDEQLGDLALRGVDVGDASRSLTTFDIRWACDVLRPVFDASDGVDGKVSIEVDPRLAADTAQTIAEARALNWLVDRPNVYIKIPATRAGLPAITACLAEGININVTLIFSIARYREVMEAYLSGLEDRVAAGQPIDQLFSVASFFVSRVDTNVDAKLQKLVDAGGPDAERARARLGTAAIDNAKLAYAAFEEVFSGPRWDALAAHGANPQRPLWASTSTKNPAYRDVMYVEELIAPGTVNTMPIETLDDFQDHGEVRGPTATQGMDRARSLWPDLARLGIGEEEVGDELEVEGVQKFADSYNQAVATVARKREQVAG